MIKAVKVKPIVDGDCIGEAVVIDNYISFFGEVDPVKGVHRPTGKSIAGKVLVFRGGRGSTVGSYIIYSLKKHMVCPKCMVVAEAEPIIVVGAVLTDTPLLVVLGDFDLFIKNIHDGVTIKYYRGGDKLVYGE